MNIIEEHLRTHIASVLALAGAENQVHRGMIESAIRGTWEYATKYERERCINICHVANKSHVDGALIIAAVIEESAK